MKIIPDITLSRWLAIALALFSCAVSAQPADSHAAALQEVGLYNATFPRANLITGGQPTPAQLNALRLAGVNHVINLRSDEEMDWDEASLVRSLGMRYYSIPIAGASGLTQDNAQALDTLLQTLEQDSVLLHCASGNRVGALIALSAAQHGEPMEAAIEKGKRWGMTRLEALVREKISDSVQVCCADTATTAND